MPSEQVLLDYHSVHHDELTEGNTYQLFDGSINVFHHPTTALIAEVQRRMHEISGVALEPEVRLWE